MGKIKILMVDDERDFIELMGTYIRNWGYDLIKAYSGKEAVAAINDQNPDILVLDYLMPVMDGLAVLKEIRKINRKLPVIVYTAHPDPTIYQVFEGLNVSGFIPKLSATGEPETALKANLEMIVNRIGKKI